MSAQECRGKNTVTRPRRLSFRLRGAAGTAIGRLLVKAGLTPLDALRAATSGAAECLGAAGKAGRISAGGDASLVLVEGNPLEDISSTERIVEVFFHGESVNRGNLIEKK